MGGQAHRQAGTLAGRQAGRRAGRQAHTQAGTHTGRQTHTRREGKRGREGEKQSDTQTDRTQSWCYAHVWQEAGSIDGAIDFFRAYELDPAFECLMDHPSVYLSRTKVRVQLSVSLYVSSSCINVNGDRYPILATALQSGRGGEPGEPRLRDPVVQYMPGHTQGAQWHRDGFNIRLTYILDDLEEDGGGTAWCAFASRTCLAAHCRLHLPVDRLTVAARCVCPHSVATSHLDKLRNEEQYLPLPPWFKANPLGAPADAPIDEESRRIVTPLAGMPAGSCMINWTGALCLCPPVARCFVVYRVVFLVDKWRQWLPDS